MGCVGGRVRGEHEGCSSAAKGDREREEEGWGRVAGVVQRDSVLQCCFVNAAV